MDMRSYVYHFLAITTKYYCAHLLSCEYSDLGTLDAMFLEVAHEDHISHLHQNVTWCEEKEISYYVRHYYFQDYLLSKHDEPITHNTVTIDLYLNNGICNTHTYAHANIYNY